MAVNYFGPVSVRNISNARLKAHRQRLADSRPLRQDDRFSLMQDLLLVEGQATLLLVSARQAVFWLAVLQANPELAEVISRIDGLADVLGSEMKIFARTLGAEGTTVDDFAALISTGPDE